MLECVRCVLLRRLEVLEVMRCVLLCMLEAVERVRDVLKLLKVMRYVLWMLEVMLCML